MIKTVEIAAAPERVWSVMSDVAKWPEWTASIVSVSRLDSGPFAVGAKAVVRQPWMLPALWEVTVFEPPRRFVWVSRGPGFAVAGSHAVEPRGAGSLATLGVEFSGPLGPLLERLTAGLTEKYVSMEAAGLKARSEGTK